jgi:hypothetical protein
LGGGICRDFHMFIRRPPPRKWHMVVIGDGKGMLGKPHRRLVAGGRSRSVAAVREGAQGNRGMLVGGLSSHFSTSKSATPAGESGSSSILKRASSQTSSTSNLASTSIIIVLVLEE